MPDRAQILISAIDEASGVLDKVERKMGSVGAAADKLQYALQALGAGYAVNAFANMIEGAIGAENALYELNLKTGLSVELLSALRPIAAEAGSNMDLVGTSVQKLERNMLAFVQTGVGPAALGFKAIGISQQEARAGLQDMNAFLPEFAKRLLASGNGAQVAALAQEIFGKAGANLIPVLEALAEKVELVGTRTKEQVARAHEFTVSMANLSEQTHLLEENMANGLLPALTQISAAFADARVKADGVTSSFEVLGDGMKFVTKMGIGVWAVLDGMGNSLGALNASFDLLKRGDMAGAMAVLQDWTKQADNIVQDAATRMKRLSGDAPTPAAHGAAAGAGTGNFDIGGKGAGGNSGKTSGTSDRLLAIGEKGEIDALIAKAKAWQDAENAVNDYKNSVIDAATKQNDLLKQQADSWLALLDPTQKYYDQLDQIETLVEKGNLTRDQGDKAEAMVMDKLQASMKGTNDAAKQAIDFGKQMGLTFSSAFEDAFVKGKSLRDVLQGIEQDIMRIATRQLVTQPIGNAISGAVSGAFSGSGGLGGLIQSIFGGGGAEAAALAAGIAPLATGGDVYAGQAYLVGEKGPELFTPGSSGAIVPNHALGRGAAAPTIIMNISTPHAASFVSNRGNIIADMSRALSAARRNL